MNAACKAIGQHTLAAQIAARLMRNDSVSFRVAELRNELASTVAAIYTLNSGQRRETAVFCYLSQNGPAYSPRARAGLQGCPPV